MELELGLELIVLNNTKHRVIKKKFNKMEKNKKNKGRVSERKKEKKGND